MKSFADLKSLEKEIASIAVAGKKLDARIQSAGVGVLEHLAEHRDTGPVNRLYLALGKGARHSAMTSWLLAHGSLVANTDSLTKREKPFLFDKEKVTSPDAAELDPWYNHKPSKGPDMVLDLQAAIRSIFKKAMTAPALKGGTVDTLKLLAQAVGIPESDVPTMVKPDPKDVGINSEAPVMAEEEAE